MNILVLNAGSASLRFEVIATPESHTRVLEEFDWFGLAFDPERNEQTINREGRITTDGSRLHAYVIPVEEGLAERTARTCLRSQTGSGLEKKSHSWVMVNGLLST
jgi:acetate kinase